MEPSRPSFAMAAVAASSGPHPWRRYLARSLDYLWYFPVAGFTITAGFVLLLSKEEAEMFFAIPDFMLTLILIALWLPIEAGFLSLLGATPAKWLFGIRIEAEDGRRLRFGPAMERALRVWVQGLGLGIPIVSLITSIFAYNRLNSTGTTLWDTAVPSLVRHREWTTGRILLCILLVLLFGALVVALSLFAGRSGS
jgi:uncharacterized RDD family membrane protein YckC